MISDVTDGEFQTKVLQAGIPTLVDFWAPWCGPCVMAAPALEELSEEFSGRVEIVKMNVDENPSVAQNYGVMSIPTTILFQEGKEVDRQIGFAGKGAFEDLIRKVVK